MTQDTGDIAAVPDDQQEDEDRPDLDAEGGDDSQLDELLFQTLNDPGPVVTEEELQ
ncbi:MAG: hypothetical protein ABR616_05900 [Dermatophilaceae bacterium]